MTKLIPDHFKEIVVVERPAIKLLSGHVVSMSSGPYTPVEAIEFAARFQQPLQTADLAVIVKDELDKNPLVGADGKPCLDGSNLYQRLSDLICFYPGKTGNWLAVSDLHCVYGDDWQAQVEAARRIGWRLVAPIEDELIVRILDTAGGRKVKVPDLRWPYFVQDSNLAKDEVALAIFPEAAGRYGEYLARKHWGGCKIFLDVGGVAGSWNLGNCAVLRPLALGGDYVTVADAEQDVHGIVGHARVGRSKLVEPPNLK